MQIDDEEYLKIVSDILNDSRFLNLKSFVHHGVNRYEHSLKVSYKAYKYAKAKEISIFDYSNIVFSALISFMLFGTLPDYLSVVGYIIIFTVSLYMFLYNKKLDKIDNK